MFAGTKFREFHIFFHKSENLRSVSSETSGNSLFTVVCSRDSTVACGSVNPSNRPNTGKFLHILHLLHWQQLKIVPVAPHLHQGCLKSPQNHRQTKKDRLHDPPSLKVCLGLCTVAVTWQVLSTSATALLSRSLKLADFHNQSPLLTMIEGTNQNDRFK